MLRTTLLPSLVDSVRRNLDAGNTGIGLWEIAHVYLRREGGSRGLARGAGPSRRGARGRLRAREGRRRGALPRPAQAGRVQACQPPAFHPGKTAAIEAGVVGELHPALLEGTWGAFELDLATLVAGANDAPEYEDVVTFPAVKQDLAFVVAEDVPAEELVAAAREAAGPELREMRPFDVYHGPQVGEGRKSVAFAVTFQSPERTLSDEDAAALRQRIVAALRRAPRLPSSVPARTVKPVADATRTRRPNAKAVPPLAIAALGAVLAPSGQGAGGTLIGTVGPGFTISLTMNGAPVTAARPGRLHDPGQRQGRPAQLPPFWARRERGDRRARHGRRDLERHLRRRHLLVRLRRARCRRCTAASASGRRRRRRRAASSSPTSAPATRSRSAPRQASALRRSPVAATRSRSWTSRRRDSFHLSGPGVNKKTGTKFTGTVTWKVTLKTASAYRYWSDARPTLGATLKTS